MRFSHISFLVLILIPLIYSYGEDKWKSTCTANGRTSLSNCKFWYGFKSMWRINWIAWFPSDSRNMTFLELRSHCDDYFVCLENTGCYKDFVNYQELDRCIDDTFELGPMSYCEKTLRTVMKSSPGNVSECVKTRLNDMNPAKFDCESIQKHGECFLPEVEKHCDSNLVPLFKEHMETRLFNRACGGRLRYKDWDYRGGQDYAIEVVPGGGLKVADPKRDYGMINSTDTSS